MPIYEHEPFANHPRRLNFEPQWFKGCAKPQPYQDEDGTTHLALVVSLSRRYEQMLMVHDHQTGTSETITEAEMVQRKAEGKPATNKPNGEPNHDGTGIYESIVRTKRMRTAAKSMPKWRSRYTTKRVLVEVEGGDYFYRYVSEEKARLDAVTLYRQCEVELPEWAQPGAAVLSE